VDFAYYLWAAGGDAGAAEMYHRSATSEPLSCDGREHPDEEE